MAMSCRRFSPRRGTTLVEAVLGMALLGTLLVTMLVAGSRMTAQRGRVERRLEACQAADALLESWWTNRSALPRSASGDLPGRPGWTWRTTPVPSDGAKALEAEVLAVEVFAPGAGGPDREPAARVEILMPKIAEAAESGEKVNEQPLGTDAR
jgi:hypothetical protein